MIYFLFQTIRSFITYEEFTYDCIYGEPAYEYISFYEIPAGNFYCMKGSYFVASNVSIQGDYIFLNQSEFNNINHVDNPLFLMKVNQ